MRRGLPRIRQSLAGGKGSRQNVAVNTEQVPASMCERKSSDGRGNSAPRRFPSVSSPSMYLGLSNHNILHYELSFRSSPSTLFGSVCTARRHRSMALILVSFCNFNSLGTTINTSYSFFPQTLLLQLQLDPLAAQVGKQQIGRRRVAGNRK